MIVLIYKSIKEYIKNNEVTSKDVPRIVKKFFPTNEQLKESMLYLRENLEQYKNHSDEHLLRHTRNIINATLKDCIEQLIDEKNSKFSMDEITEELGKYEWDDSHGYNDDE